MKDAIHESDSVVLAGSTEEIRRRLQESPGQEVIALVTNEGSSERTTALSELIQLVATDFETALLKHHRESLVKMIEAYAEMVPLDNTELLQAKMIRNARKTALESTSWVTAREIGELAELTSSNPSVQVSKWKRDHRIFSITRGNVALYPAYALDSAKGYRPVKGLRPILELFGDRKDGWGIAYWFSSVNSHLGGKRPQDLLASEPDRVLAAAQQEVAEVAHS